MKTLKNVLALLLIISLFSCSNDDNEDTSNNTAIFTAKINGEEFVATSLSNATIIRSTQLNQQRFDITAKNDSNSFNLALESSYGDCMPEIAYDGDNALVFFNYILSGGNTIMEHDPHDEDGNSAIVVVITSCSDNKISGTFSGEYNKMGILQTEIVTPEVVTITEGKFENIPFTIITQ